REPAIGPVVTFGVTRSEAERGLFIALLLGPSRRPSSRTRWRAPQDEAVSLIRPSKRLGGVRVPSLRRHDPDQVRRVFAGVRELSAPYGAPLGTSPNLGRSRGVSMRWRPG